MRRFKLSLVVVLLVTAFAQAQGPIQLSLFPGAQIVPENENVTAFRLALYGKNTSTEVFDLALVAQNTDGHSRGVQWAFVGLQNDFTGWQYALVNYNTGEHTGLMTGGVNYTQNFTGLQWGLVNYTDTANGLQLGLLNFINKGGMLPIFPFFNFSFK
jgi:hypothetical protein